MKIGQFTNKENFTTNIEFKNFKHIKIDPRKRSDALDLMQMHLSKVHFYAERIFSNIEKPKLLFSFMMQDDLKTINKLILFIHNIESYYSKKIETISNCEQFKVIKEKQIKNDTTINTMNPDIERQLKNNSKEIEKLKKILSIFVNKCKEEDLKKIYHSLIKKKDHFEITVVTNLAIIILNQLKIYPSHIQKCTKNYINLIEQMKKFKGSESTFTIDEARDIWSNLKNILNKIDPKKSNNKELVDRYSHLLNYASWAIAAIELIYNFQVLKEYNGLKEKKLKENLETCSKMLPCKNDLGIMDLYENAKINCELVKSFQEDLNNLKNSISFNLILNKKQNNIGLFQSLNENLEIERKNISSIYNDLRKKESGSIFKNQFNIFHQLAEEEPKTTRCCGIIGYCKKRIKSISLK